MSDLSIVAVRHGEWRTRRSHFYLNYDVTGDADGDLVAAYWFWVVRGGARPIVIDTGFSAAGAARRGRRVLLPATEAFEALGLGPDDEVDVVITHLHYDHAGNLGYFRRARVWIAEREHAFWSSPDSRHAQFLSVADDADLGALAAVVEDGRAVMVRGRARIAPGVELVELPGHTPGQLGVIVATAGGAVLLASDALHTREELDRDMPFRHNTDLVDLYRGLATVRGWLADGSISTVVPGHDIGDLVRFPALPGALEEHARIIA